MIPRSSWLLIVFFLQVSYKFVKPLASTKIDVEDETATNSRLANLYEKLHLHRTTTTDFKIMNPSDIIVESLSIKPNGDLYAKKNIDRDILCREPFKQDHLRCCENSRDECLIRLHLSMIKNGKREYENVHLRLIDSNDNHPVFKSSTVQVSVPESNERKSITNEYFQAVDPDQGSNSIRYYKLEMKDASLPFELDSTDMNRMKLVVRGGLDRELKEQYEMKLLAIDGGSPQRTGTLTITVNVEDVNDNSPVFDKMVYTAEVDENAAVGHHVATVLATDKDADANGYVDYTITSSSPPFNSLFKITRNSRGEGLVSVQRTLDSDSIQRKKEIVMYIVARDRGNPPKTAEAKLTITVNDINNEVPRIQVIYVRNDQLDRTKGLITENKEGEDVAKIDVTDRDSGQGGEVTCSINNKDSRNFALHNFAQSGAVPLDVHRKEFMIKSIRQFNREEQRNIQFTVICQDNGVPRLTGQAKIRLRVTDENDESPVFTESIYHFTLKENCPEARHQPYQFGNVRANDKDEGENAKVKYSIMPGIYNQFKIDEDSGALYATEQFDREALLGQNNGDATVEFRVQANDKDNKHSATAIVRVEIIDVNDNAPEFKQQNYRFTVKENIDGPTYIEQVKATDRDTSSNVMYDISNNMQDVRQHFSIGKTTGKLNLQSRLDREKKSHYIIKVIASDGSSNLDYSSTATVTVDVDDDNDCTPRIISPKENQIITVPLSSKPGRKVVTVVADDCDINNNKAIKYSIVEGSNGYFEMDEKSGILIVSQTLNEGINPSQSFTLKATDKGERPRSSTVRIQLHISSDQKEDKFNEQQQEPGSSEKAKTIIIVLITFFFLLLAVAFVVVCNIIRPCKRLPNNREVPKPGRLNLQQIYDSKQIVDERRNSEIPAEHYNLMGYQKPSICDRKDIKTSGDYQTLKLKTESRSKPEMHTYYQISTVPSAASGGRTAMGYGTASRQMRGEADGELGDADMESNCSNEECRVSAARKSQPVTPATSRKFTPFCPYAEASFV